MMEPKKKGGEVMAKVFRQLCLFAFAGATSLAGQKQDPDHSLITIREIDAKLEKLASGYETVEGPLYDGKGHLLFTDIPNQRIWQLNLKTLETTLFRDETGGANGLAFDLRGRLLMCKQREKSLARLEDDGTETVLLKPTRIGGNKKIQPVGVNDVVVDRKGRIYVTVPGAGSVYLLDSDGGNPRPVISGLKGPNGLMLSPDEKTLYVSEYKEQKLHAYEVDPKNGNVSKRRLFARVLPPSDYGCDGMTVDHLGNLFFIKERVFVHIICTQESLGELVFLGSCRPSVAMARVRIRRNGRELRISHRVDFEHISNFLL